MKQLRRGSLGITAATAATAALAAGAAAFEGVHTNATTGEAVTSNGVPTSKKGPS
jgi:hypothetical protein